MVEARERASELATIPALIEDIESDLSVFHRVDDLDELSASRFFSLVQRLPAYGGAFAANLRHQRPDVGEQPMPTAVIPFPAVDVSPQAADAMLNTEMYGAIPGMPPVFSHSYAPLAPEEG